LCPKPEEQANANFGAVLSVWDRLFGTYRRLSRAELDRLVFGVRELPRAEARDQRNGYGGSKMTPRTRSVSRINR
jgi:sterol desaturase/sphingolipid hydroxylase (fatty acid hydroxylase superfamily)